MTTKRSTRAALGSAVTVGVVMAIVAVDGPHARPGVQHSQASATTTTTMSPSQLRWNESVNSVVNSMETQIGEIQVAAPKQSSLMHGLAREMTRDESAIKAEQGTIQVISSADAKLGKIGTAAAGSVERANVTYINAIDATITAQHGTIAKDGARIAALKRTIKEENAQLSSDIAVETQVVDVNGALRN